MEAVLDSSYFFSPIQQAGIPAELRSNTDQNFVLPPWPWSGHNFQCLRIPIDSCFCTEHSVAYTWDCTDALPTGRWRRGDAGVSRHDHISLDQHLTSWSLNRVILLHTFLNSSALSFGFSRHFQERSAEHYRTLEFVLPFYPAGLHLHGRFGKTARALCLHLLQRDAHLLKAQ